jgi:hypothetical protein
MSDEYRGQESEIRSQNESLFSKGLKVPSGTKDFSPPL